MNDELEQIEDKLEQDIETQIARHMNRAQRRALMKKTSKKNRQNIQQFNEAIKKIDYIHLIEELRELNKKKENENYDSNEAD